jgi:hypothetical protein
VWFGVSLSAQQHETAIRAESSDVTPDNATLTAAQILPSSDLASRPRVSAEQLLEGRDVTGSFEALQSLIGSGHEIVVTDTAGRARRGRVVTIARDHLVMASPAGSGVWEGLLPLYFPLDLGLVFKRRFLRSQDRTFSEQSVVRIDIVDSTSNGTAIGAAVGAGLVAGVYMWERRQPDASLKGLATFLALVVGFPVSLRVGHVLDRAINEPIYRRPAGTRRVTVSPSLAHGVKGVAVDIQF